MASPTTLHEIRERFMAHNEGFKNEANPLTAVIVYKQSNWNKPYTEAERSYRVYSNRGKAFYSGMISNSMYGDSLDGSDLGVRLDCYRWEIERCYFE